MVETVIGSLDCKSLAQRLYRHLQTDAITQDKLTSSQGRSLPVDCFVETGILKVILHLAAQPTLETNALFSCTRDFLANQGITPEYDVKIYLVVDEAAPVISPTALAPLARPGVVALTQTFPPALAAILKDDRWQELLSWRGGLGIGLGLGVLGLVGYGLTRPCVLDHCPSLTQAEQLLQVSPLSLQDNPQPLTFNTLLLERQLQEAIALLEPIPFWSRYYGQAREQKKDYQARLAILMTLNQSMGQANQAQQLLQKSPLSAQELQAVVTLWQKVLVDLQPLSLDNPYRPIVQQQRQMATQGLRLTQQRLLDEQQAEQFWQKASEQAVLARVQGSNVRSLGELNRLAVLWQGVLQNLQKIPLGTSVSPKALKQAEVYGREYRNLESRRQAEAQAEARYQEAIAVSKVAEQASLSQRWNMAVTQWQKAVNLLKGIPETSFVGEKAKNLLLSAMLQLQTAQTYFQGSQRSQQVKQQLESLCSQWTRTCDYRIEKDRIQVRLTDSYVRQIWDTALKAKAQGNLPGQTGVLNHISYLEQTLQTISTQSGLPLELYHAKGHRLNRYQP
ncbi:MAG: hypothetical protein VKK07_02320 [Merismopediaceae bacterium]|nr:hypothetical protein [Merismopediaceae bacterium]